MLSSNLQNFICAKINQIEAWKNNSENSQVDSENLFKEFCNTQLPKFLETKKNRGR